MEAPGIFIFSGRGGAVAKGVWGTEVASGVQGA